MTHKNSEFVSSYRIFMWTRPVEVAFHKKEWPLTYEQVNVSSEEHITNVPSVTEIKSISIPKHRSPPQQLVNACELRHQQWVELHSEISLNTVAYTAFHPLSGVNLSLNNTWIVVMMTLPLSHICTLEYGLSINRSTSQSKFIFRLF